MPEKSSAAETPCILLYVQYYGTFKYCRTQSLSLEMSLISVIRVVKSGTVESRV